LVVGVPLSVEVIIVELWLCAYPSGERLIVVWLSVHPSKCRGDCCGVVTPSNERLILFWISVHPSKCRGDLCCGLPLV